MDPFRQRWSLIDCIKILTFKAVFVLCVLLIMIILMSSETKLRASPGIKREFTEIMPLIFPRIKKFGTLEKFAVRKIVKMVNFLFYMKK